jgi:acetoin utilization deacetylase AcuC-like enzyme
MIFFRRKQKAYIVFSSDYLIGVSTYGDHHSFDIFKYKRIRDLLISDKILKPKNIQQPQIASFNDIGLVHSQKYIQHIKDPITVNQLLKIEINSLWDNTVLGYFMAVTGGTICATFKALEYKVPVFNMGGGFHHAQPQESEGFCLINDVAIAIRKIKKKKNIGKILIVDLDYHQGNGNSIIFKNDADVFTFSVHADHWIEEIGVSNRDILIDSTISNEDYLAIVENELEKVLSIFNPQLIFYIAGSDPYEKDELADMKIDRTTMLKRNMYVLSKALELKAALVVLPGGGYGKDSWEIYYDFVKTALSK